LTRMNSQTAKIALADPKFWHSIVICHIPYGSFD
jgi:hypothetical protein